MDSLAGKLTGRALRAALGDLPKKLDDIYDQAMQRIKQQGGEKASLAIAILYWISYALRPLTVVELPQALSIQPGDIDLNEEGLHDEELIISVCLGLVTVDRESNNIRLMHYTTQEYFERTRQEEFLDAPRAIAKTCLTYLMFDVFNETCCQSIEDLAMRLEKYPFLRYASRYWANHTREVTDQAIFKLVLVFLNQSISLISSSQVSQTLRDPHFAGRARRTRLQVAASTGLVDIARYLLDQGADINAKGTCGQTPLFLAAMTDQHAMVSLLLDRGADMVPRGEDKWTAFHQAAQSGHVTVVQTLLSSGVTFHALTFLAKRRCISK